MGNRNSAEHHDEVFKRDRTDIGRDGATVCVDDDLLADEPQDSDSDAPSFDDAVKALVEKALLAAKRLHEHGLNYESDITRAKELHEAAEYVAEFEGETDNG